MITMNMVIGNRFFEGFFSHDFSRIAATCDAIDIYFWNSLCFFGTQLARFQNKKFTCLVPSHPANIFMLMNVERGKKCCKIARWQTLPQRNQHCLKPPKPFNKWKRKPNIVFRSVCAFRNCDLIFFGEQTKCLRFNLCEWYTNDLHQSVRDCNWLLHIEAVGFPTETFCPIPIVRVPPMSCFGFGNGNVPFHPWTNMKLQCLLEKWIQLFCIKIANVSSSLQTNNIRLRQFQLGNLAGALAIPGFEHWKAGTCLTVTFF